MSDKFPDYHGYLRLAHEMADATGEVLRQAFLKRPAIEIKEDRSFVTEFDKAVEQTLRQMIEEEYPHHGILGEEFESKNTDADLVWVLDPIDGTAQFIAGIPVFGTLIGLAWEGQPFLGVMNHPATGDRWAGVSGKFAEHNGRPVQSRGCSGPESAFVTCSNPDFMTDIELSRFRKLRDIATYVQYGGSCLAYGLLASGRTNLAIDSAFEPFDYFACAAVIRGAGGVFSNWDGEDVGLDWTGGILAAGDRVCHNKAVEILSRE